MSKFDYKTRNINRLSISKQKQESKSIPKIRNQIDVWELITSKIMNQIDVWEKSNRLLKIPKIANKNKIDSKIPKSGTKSITKSITKNPKIDSKNQQTRTKLITKLRNQINHKTDYKKKSGTIGTKIMNHKIQDHKPQEPKS